MNELNKKVIVFTNQSNISGADLINLGKYLMSHMDSYVLSRSNFDRSHRDKKPTKDKPSIQEDSKPADDIIIF